MKKRRIFTSSLSLILAMLIIFYAIPASVFAAESYAVPENSGESLSDSFSYEAPVIEPYEIVELREENVKHFRNADGTTVAAMYSYPVHTADVNGELVDIDNALESSFGGVYANSSSRIKFSKKINGTGSMFTLHDGNTKVRLSLIGAIKGTAGSVKNGEDAKEDTELQKMMNLEKLSASIVYRDILDGVDLEYIAHSLNVKENIIVKKPQESYSYAFELKLNGLEASLSESGDVLLRDNSTSEIKYVIPAPVVYDGAGVYAPGEAAWYNLEENSGSGKYTLTVTADSEWMNAHGRALPITIDPTLSTLSSNALDTSINSANPTAVYGNDSTLPMTSTCIAYWKTPTLPTIPSFVNILSAELRLRASLSSGNWVAAYEVLTDWDETMTWNSHTSSSTNHGQLGSKVIDYNVIGGGFYTWDLTELVKKWYNGANYGVAFKSIKNQTYGFSFYSSEDLVVNDRPTLTVTYKDRKGVESYWPYSSHSVGLGGNGSVNLSNGQLTLAIPTLSTTDSLMPYTPTLIYNSLLSNKTHTNNYTESGNYYSYLGYGFKLNICETVIRKTYMSNAGNTVTYYIYSDADGTEHSFNQIGSTGTYTDDDGLQKILTVNSDGGISITDDSNYTWIFGQQANNANVWFLEKIEDNNGNRILFTYDSSRRPTKVSLTPKNSSTIDMLELSYYSTGKLKMIYNPTSKQAAVFRYSQTAMGGMSTTSTLYLRQIDYAKGSSAVTATNWNDFCNSEANKTNITLLDSALYSYNSNGYIMGIFVRSAELPDKTQGVSYMWTNNKLSKITQYADGTMGQRVSYTYGTGYTDALSTGNDETLNTADDIKTRYVYDKYGRTVSLYSSSADGTEIYGGSLSAYETQENIKNNLKEQTVIGGSAVNYLLNGNFEQSSTSIGYTHWETVGNVSGVLGMYIIEGENSPELTIAPGGTASLSQYVSLMPGKYTLSFQYFRASVMDITGIISVSSISGSGFSHSESFSAVGNYNNQTSFVTSFELPERTTADNLKITIQFTADANNTSSATIYMDCAMLENGIGASGFSMVNYGSFSLSGIDSSGNIKGQTDYWTVNSTGSSYGLVNSDTPFEKAMRINADLASMNYASQRIYEVSDSLLSQYQNPYYEGITVNNEYVVSGFAKAANASLSSNSKFSLRVDVTYYRKQSNTDTVVSHYFDFLPSCTDWQFVAGKFGTGDYTYLKYIDVYCVYGYQNEGYALFDNIFVTRIKNETTKYYYYSSGTENGLISRMENIFYTEYYEYDENRNVSRIANNKGELTDYTYTSTNLVNTVVKSDYTWNSGYSYPHWLDNPDAELQKTPKVRTYYTYNSYGLCTSEETYLVNADLTRVESGRRFYNTYTYSTSSKIFGAPVTETNSALETIKYFYDLDNGWLIATLNTSTGDGLAYTYNARGDMTSVRPAKVSVSSYTAEQNTESVGYEYDGNHRLSRITTESTVYNFTYDKFGNTESVKVGSSNLATYEYYGNNGKLKKVNYGNGFSEEYIYNDIELLSEIWYNYSNGTRKLAYSYEYTSDGQVYKLIDYISEKTTVYKYDYSGKFVNFIEYDNSELESEYRSRATYNDKGEVQHVYYVINQMSAGSYKASEWDYGMQYETDGKLSVYSYNTKLASGSESYTYDDYGRMVGKDYLLSLKSNSSSKFRNIESYTYASYGSENTSTRVSGYTSQINGANTAYSYTYDGNGNITKIVIGGNTEIRYVYDNLGQLIREDNQPLNCTILYTYDNAGNITTAKKYSLTAAGSTPTSLISTETYTYGNTNWKDQLTAYNGTGITYDAVGNPLSYYNGFSFTWVGRQMQTATKNGVTYSFTYNGDGIRTSKTKNGVETVYYIDGSKIVSEETQGDILVYIYDSNGMPIGMQYRGAGYANDTWDIFWFEKNLQGDIVAVYNHSGTKLVSYKYDAWGNFTVSYHNGTTSSSVAAKNPFRYRGYYYDTDLGLYYCGTRYYDSNTGRWINADSMMSGVNGSLHGYNLYVYCFNNPVMHTDHSGNWPSWNEIGNFFYKIGEAILTSMELEIGIGLGIGANISDNITAEISRDTFVGFDDGELITGNVITAEMSLFDSNVSIGDTYKHVVEKGGRKITSSGSAMDGPFDMINYPDVTHGNQLTILIVSVDNDGDLVVGISPSVHMGFGGYFYVGFNVTEFMGRLRK